MSMIETLITRTSCGSLQAPGPNRDELRDIVSTALRAPDHRRLKPWLYLTFDTPEALGQLGDLLGQAYLQENPDADEAKLEKVRSKPHRAPVVIAAITKYIEHPKVPRVEQIASVAAGVQNILLAVDSLGYAGYWRTGSLANHEVVQEGLGLSPEDELVGFIYVGTGSIDCKPVALPELEDHLRFM